MRPCLAVAVSLVMSSLLGGSIMFHWLGTYSVLVAKSNKAFRWGRRIMKKRFRRYCGPQPNSVGCLKHDIHSHNNIFIKSLSTDSLLSERFPLSYGLNGCAYSKTVY